MIKLNYINDAVDFQNIDRILVIKLQLLGDVLLTTPLYSVIKQQFPHIKIDVLIYKETLTVIAENPHINQIHQIDREWKKQGTVIQLVNEYSLLKQLKTNNYDLVVNLTDRWRGGWLTRFLKPK
ncbi:MAG: putative lipopolysaccharide heptosyltransferase III, partial [Methylomarinum sp.]|nr:putative lipopolysaccharide heptosyltransferase III [Methylomarinum sp.]